MNKSFLTVKEAATGAVFLALITAGAYIAIPVGPVPFVLQNFFIMVAALVLPVRVLIVVMLSYLTAGALGLPVFSGGKGGIAHFAGPTAGYLLAYLPAAVGAAIISRAIPVKYLSSAIALIFFNALVYGAGVAWLGNINPGFGWVKAVAVGFTPFIIPDLFKTAAAVLTAAIVNPLLARSRR